MLSAGGDLFFAAVVVRMASNIGLFLVWLQVGGVARYFGYLIMALQILEALTKKNHVIPTRLINPSSIILEHIGKIHNLAVNALLKSNQVNEMEGGVLFGFDYDSSTGPHGEDVLDESQVEIVSSWNVAENIPKEMQFEHVGSQAHW